MATCSSPTISRSTALTVGHLDVVTKLVELGAPWPHGKGVPEEHDVVTQLVENYKGPRRMQVLGGGALESWVGRGVTQLVENYKGPRRMQVGGGESWVGRGKGGGKCMWGRGIQGCAYQAKVLAQTCRASPTGINFCCCCCCCCCCRLLLPAAQHGGEAADCC